MSADGFKLEATRDTLFGALIGAARRFGAATPILEDPERQPLGYRRLILESLVIGARLARETDRAEALALLLPNVAPVAATLFGLSAYGRVPAMMNPTAGLANLRQAALIGRLRLAVTSRRFIAQARLEAAVAELETTEGRPGERLRFLYLEDMRAALTSLDKLAAAALALAPGLVHARHALGPDDPAVILFTSGSEGAPKGVALSSANLLANTRQIEAHIGSPPLGSGAVMFNPLPVFHSLGLTGGLLLPLFTGTKTVLYPSPLHYRQIPKLIRETGATIVLGTDTFLRNWAKAAEPGDLTGVRFVVAGAEAVRDDTRAAWSREGATILEGYGATECAPVISVNQPFDNRPGTAGRMLPGIEHRLDAVEGLAEGGRLRVRGPNVMAGYLLAAEPGRLHPPADGWHDTGDIVTLDAQGRVTIKGRARRFAKIGGEMVSLGAVEALAAALWPDAAHVAVSLPDPRKGEEIVLLTDRPQADRAALLAYAKARGYPELWVPRAVLAGQDIPLLATGKADIAAARDLAEAGRPSA